MKITQALKIAGSRVAIVAFGDGYQIHEYRPAARATHVSHSMTWAYAVGCAKEVKIRIALDLLGVEDAYDAAHQLAEQPGAWRDLVRQFHRS